MDNTPWGSPSRPTGGPPSQGSGGRIRLVPSTRKTNPIDGSIEQAGDGAVLVVAPPPFGSSGAGSSGTDSSSVPSRPKRPLTKLDAVCRVQALFRGKLDRLAAQKRRLLVAWHELDRKEEEELAATHSEYVYLKTQVGLSQVRAAEGAGAGNADADEDEDLIADRIAEAAVTTEAADVEAIGAAAVKAAAAEVAAAEAAAEAAAILAEIEAVDDDKDKIVSLDSALPAATAAAAVSSGLLSRSRSPAAVAAEAEGAPPPPPPTTSTPAPALSLAPAPPPPAASTVDPSPIPVKTQSLKRSSQSGLDSFLCSSSSLSAISADGSDSTGSATPAAAPPTATGAGMSATPQVPSRSARAGPAAPTAAAATAAAPAGAGAPLTTSSSSSSFVGGSGRSGLALDMRSLALTTSGGSDDGSGSRSGSSSSSGPGSATVGTGGLPVPPQSLTPAASVYSSVMGGSASSAASERSEMAAAQLLIARKLADADEAEEYEARVKARLLQLRLLREFRQQAVPLPSHDEGDEWDDRTQDELSIADLPPRQRAAATAADAAAAAEAASVAAALFGAPDAPAPSAAATAAGRGIAPGMLKRQQSLDELGMRLDDIFSTEFWAPDAQVGATPQFKEFLSSAAPRLASLRAQGLAASDVSRAPSHARGLSGHGRGGPAPDRVSAPGVSRWPRAAVRPLSRSRPVDAAWVAELTDELAAGKTVPLRSAERLVLLSFPLLARASNVQECTVVRSGKVTVVGDLHGQLADLLSVFKFNGPPSPMNQYVFNGDWVDRGAHSCECLFLILAWKVLLPHCVFLNRGNHEAQDINSRDGFEKEVLSKYNPDLFALISELFACVPLATTIHASVDAQNTALKSNQRIPSVFVLHGGLPACAPRLTIKDIRAIDRFHVIPPPNSLLCDLLWSDPGYRPGARPNSRGAGVEFGPDITAAFLARNQLCMLVRSHECVDNGWQLMHSNQCFTVFSASNYCGVVGNQGAYAIFEGNLRPTLVTYYAQDKVFSARSSTRYRLLEQDVVRKLMDRIAVNRLDLIERYRAFARWNVANNPLVAYSDEVITRSQWAEGLSEVLGLNLPFLLFQDQLGLPDRGVLGDEKGPINYMMFLAPFQPSHLALKSVGLATYSGMSDTSSVAGSYASSLAESQVGGAAASDLEAIQHLSTLLFAYKYELQSVFRFFDHDGDDTVTTDEFASGILAIIRLFRARARLMALEGPAASSSDGGNSPGSRKDAAGGTAKGEGAAKAEAAAAASGVLMVPPTLGGAAASGTSSVERPTPRAALTAAQQKILTLPWGMKKVRRIARLVDLNGDGVIQFSEFFAHFDYQASGASAVLRNDGKAQPLADKYRASCPTDPRVTSVVPSADSAACPR